MPRIAAAASIAVFVAVAASGPASAGSGGASPPAAGGSPARGSLHITEAKCIPAQHCQANPRYVAPGGKLAIAGTGLIRGQLVVFPRKSNASKLIGSKL